MKTNLNRTEATMKLVIAMMIALAFVATGNAEAAEKQCDKAAASAATDKLLEVCTPSAIAAFQNEVKQLGCENFVKDTMKFDAKKECEKQLPKAAEPKAAELAEIRIPNDKASEADFSLCPDRALDWYIAVFPIGQIADYASKAPDRMTDKQVADPGGKVPPTAWRKAGITPKQESEVTEKVLGGLPVGFNAATNNVRKFLPREELDAKGSEGMDRICKRTEDKKSWMCNGTDMNFVEKARAFYGSLTFAQKSKDMDALFARIADDKALKSLKRDAERFGADLAMSHISIACGIAELAPNAPREFLLAGKVHQGRKQINPSEAKKGQTVYILRQDGSVQGPVLEELNDGALKVSTSQDNPYVLMDNDVRKGDAKLYADPHCESCGETDLRGKSVTLKDSDGHSIGSGTVSGVSPLEVTSTTLIERGTGLPISLGASFVGIFGRTNGGGKVEGEALNGFKVDAGYRLRLGDRWFLNPYVTGGFGYVTGERSDRTQNTPTEQRFVGLLGGGLKAGIDLGRFSPYAVVEGLGLPGPGFSGGLGVQVGLNSIAKLDVSGRWTYLPDTGVKPGLNSHLDLGTVGVNGFSLVAGIQF